MNNFNKNTLTLKILSKNLTQNLENFKTLKEEVTAFDQNGKPSFPKHQKAKVDCKKGQPQLAKADALKVAKLTGTDMASLEMVNENFSVKKPDKPNPKRPLKERVQEHMDVIAWLSAIFPNAFNYKDPKPLKIDILEDIFEKLPEYDTTFSKTRIRKAIKHYASSIPYYNCLLSQSERVDLNGEVVQLVEEKHQEYSKISLTKRKEYCNSQIEYRKNLRTKKFKKHKKLQKDQETTASLQGESEFTNSLEIEANN
jgi:sRNA-binding protein